MSPHDDDETAASHADDGDTLPPSVTGYTGSVGTQKSVSTTPATVPGSAVVYTGIKTLTTQEQLETLARSGVSPEVKAEIIVSLLFGASQTIESDLRVRLEDAHRESSRLRRLLDKEKEDSGKLRGDKRVLAREIEHLRDRKRRDLFLTALSNLLFAVGGAFIGQANAAAVLAFVVGAALFFHVWFQRPQADDSEDDG